MSELARDSLVHYIHFAFIFALASMLACEIALFGKSLSRDTFNRLRVIDRWYGIMAALVILSGLSLLTFGLKPASFFLDNPVFWTKMALFVGVALLSIPMTLLLLRARTNVDGSVVFQDAEHGRLRAFLLAQVVLFALIPLCAALMANGIGR
jgi:putative membrane protein